MEGARQDMSEINKVRIMMVMEQRRKIAGRFVKRWRQKKMEI